MQQTIKLKHFIDGQQIIQQKTNKTNSFEVLAMLIKY